MEFGLHGFPRNAEFRVLAQFFCTPVEFIFLLLREFVIEIAEFQINGFDEFAPLRFWHPAQFFEDFRPAHGIKFNRR